MLVLSIGNALRFLYNYLFAHKLFSYFSPCLFAGNSTECESFVIIFWVCQEVVPPQMVLTKIFSFLLGYCGNSLTNNGASGAIIPSTFCSNNCGGDSSQKCGGGWTLSVYKK